MWGGAGVWIIVGGVKTAGGGSVFPGSWGGIVAASIADASVAGSSSTESWIVGAWVVSAWAPWVRVVCARSSDAAGA